MNFDNVFKSSFLEKVTSVSILDTTIALIIALCIGLYICYVYKKTYSGVLYSAAFSVSLLGLTLITTTVILAVTSNVVLSLGMVGALSIVRFRTAIKEPLDIVFLFWSIAVGIILAAGMLPLAVIGSAIIGITLLIFANRNTNSNPYIVILQCDDHDAEKSAKDYLESKVLRSVVKSKSARKGKIELNMEIRLKNDNTDFVNELSDLNGVNNAVLISYNGDYMG